MLALGVLLSPLPAQADPISDLKKELVEMQTKLEDVHTHMVKVAETLSQDEVDQVFQIGVEDIPGISAGDLVVDIDAALSGVEVELSMLNDAMAKAKKMVQETEQETNDE